MKVRICIASECHYFDEEVYFEVDMPYIPRIGTYVWTTEEVVEHIKSRIIEKKMYGDYLILLTSEYQNRYFSLIDLDEIPEPDRFDLAILEMNIECSKRVIALSYDVSSGCTYISLSSGYSEKAFDESVKKMYKEIEKMRKDQN